MPHVSQQKLPAHIQQELEERMMLFLSTTSTKTRQEIFRELLTETEQTMLAKRLAILYFLNEGDSLHTIYRKLSISPSTAARYESAVLQNRFARTRSWLQQNKKAHNSLRMIAELIAVPFEARRKSLNKIVEEHV